jgi:hypothetical protein
MKNKNVAAAVEDPRDAEIERLRALVQALTEQNVLLQEALRQLQQDVTGTPVRARS